jgi:hypothetical protein
MSQPSARQVTIHRSQTGNAGARVCTVDPVNGVQCLRGDIVPHPLGGWHVCVVNSAFYPGSGLPANSSNDQFVWSTGPSYSGMGVPPAASSANYDASQTGYGTDGRITGFGPTGKPAF